MPDFSNDFSTWWKGIFSNQKQAWLTMSSGSMYPLMPTGAQILVKPVDHSSLREGDIVVYVEQHQLVAHRLFKVDWIQNQCLQGGDNALSTAVISLDNVIGVVEKIKVNDKEVDLKSRTGKFLTHFMLTSRLGIIPLKQRWPKIGYLLHRVILRFVRIILI